MKMTCDAEVDILRIVLSDQQVYESDEDKPGIIIQKSTIWHRSR